MSMLRVDRFPKLIEGNVPENLYIVNNELDHFSDDFVSGQAVDK